MLFLLLACTKPPAAPPSTPPDPTSHTGRTLDEAFVGLPEGRLIARVLEDPERHSGHWPVGDGDTYYWPGANGTIAYSATEGVLWSTGRLPYSPPGLPLGSGLEPLVLTSEFLVAHNAPGVNELLLVSRQDGTRVAEIALDLLVDDVMAWQDDLFVTTVTEFQFGGDLSDDVVEIRALQVEPAGTTQEVWRLSFFQASASSEVSVNSSFVHASADALLVSNVHEHEVVARDPRTGNVLWTATDLVAIHHREPSTRPLGLEVNGCVLVSGESSCLDLEDGKTVWAFDPASMLGLCAGGNFADGRVLSGSTHGTVAIAVNRSGACTVGWDTEGSRIGWQYYYRVTGSPPWFEGHPTRAGTDTFAFMPGWGDLTAVVEIATGTPRYGVTGGVPLHVFADDTVLVDMGAYIGHFGPPDATVP